MGKIKDLSGKRFGLLEVIAFGGLIKCGGISNKNKATWYCLCDCGNLKRINSVLLLTGNTRSCGCLLNFQRKEQLELFKGRRFGRLVAVEPHHLDKLGGWHWLCKCDCGNEKVISRHDLVTKMSRSCGCFAREEKKKPRTHGLTGTRIMRIRSCVLQRCENPNNYQYHNYGGRGITVCKEWKEDPLAFYEWALRSGYDDKLTIDRIDNDGNYEPSNCRWVTNKEQQNNRRDNVPITYCNETKNLWEWSIITGLPYANIRSRLKRGWSVEKALTTPTGKYERKKKK